jgi:membrane protease YdiL (CAAX protease family)
MKFNLSRQASFWLFLCSFYALWAAAWLLRLYPVERLWGPSLHDLNDDSLYWFVLKCLVWILPMALYLRRIYGVGSWEYLGLSRWAKRGWAWGLALSLVMGILFWSYDLLTHVPLLSPQRFYVGPFLEAVVVSPVVEEVFFRGFMIRQLQSWWKSFPLVNLAAAVAWGLVHWIGWYFQGRLSFPGSLPFTLHLVVFGFILGYANRLSGSLWTSLILHAANNLYSDHFWNYFGGYHT